MSRSVLFQPTQLGSIQSPNRLAVAPMTRISGNANGTVGPLMTNYYADFAKGGFGLIITEGAYTDEAYSQGYINQPGIATSAQMESWKSLVKEVKSHGAKFIMQLMHAGALSQHNPYKDHTKGPSAVSPKGEQMGFYHGEGAYKTPEAMHEADIDEVIKGFVLSAERAKEAGFDGVEIHGANGYLLDQFLTDYSNQRTDRYGDSIENRIRLTCEVANAVKKQVGKDFVVGVRVSQAKVNDYEHKWRDGIAEAAIIFGRLTNTGIDYIHTTEFESDKPAFGEGPTLASLARKYSGLPVIANGFMHDADRAAAHVGQGDADFISLGRGALANANWPRLVQQGDTPTEFNPEILSPFANLENAYIFQKAS